MRMAQTETRAAPLEHPASCSATRVAADRDRMHVTSPGLPPLNASKLATRRKTVPWSPVHPGACGRRMRAGLLTSDSP